MLGGETEEDLRKGLWDEGYACCGFDRGQYSLSLFFSYLCMTVFKRHKQQTPGFPAIVVVNLC